MYGFCLLALFLLSGCRFEPEVYVDFTDIEGTEDLAFQVLSQKETDLSQGLPYDCYLPDGTPVVECNDEMMECCNDEMMECCNDGMPNGPRKTSSTTATNILQQLLDYGNQSVVTQIVGSYPSIDPEGNGVTLSGKVILPKGRRPKRLILVSHYTVGSNAEAPSNCFSLEGVLAKLGYGLIIPDYLGYGITADRVHPYLVMLQTAFSVTDMYFAVRDWLKAVGMEPEEEPIYLMGYSQGGAVTMAVEYLIEMIYSDPNASYYIPIHRVFAGGGPYDIKATYERFVNTDTTGYPIAVPLVLQGMIVGNNLNMQMSDLMQPWLCEHMDDWVNSKRYTTSQINTLIGTHVTHELLTEEAMNQKSDKIAELYKAMTDNSIISHNWQPQSSVYVLHSMDDETVPYTNATNAKSKWRDANITYNFGHYGSHIKTALRFIYSVQTLILEEEEERRQYE